MIVTRHHEWALSVRRTRYLLIVVESVYWASFPAANAMRIETAVDDRSTPALRKDFRLQPDTQ